MTTANERPRLRVEHFDDRCVLSASVSFSGFDSVIHLPLADLAGSTAVPAETFAFSGPVLVVPAAVANGRSASVAFQDGLVVSGTLQADGDGSTKIVVARDLPASGSLTGEVRLAKFENAGDQIVLGFQLFVTVEGASATSSATPRAIVQTSPTYQFALQSGPTAPVVIPGIPPPPTDTAPPAGGVVPEPSVPPPPVPPVRTRPAAPIGQSPFEAGAASTAYDVLLARGVRTVVERPTVDLNPPNATTRNELVYSFVRSANSFELIGLPDARRSEPLAFEAESNRRARDVGFGRSWESSGPPVAHGAELIEFEPAEYSPQIREMLERIAVEDSPDAVWMNESTPTEDVPATDRRPYWLVAALLGVGAGHFLRPSRDDVIALVN